MKVSLIKESDSIKRDNYYLEIRLSIILLCLIVIYYYSFPYVKLFSMNNSYSFWKFNILLE